MSIKSFEKHIESQELLFTCKSCGHEIKKSVRWIKSNNIIVCVCGAEDTFDSEQVLSVFNKITNEFAAFDRISKKLSK